MSYAFNADEIFKIGLEIEKNGRAFYEAVAARHAGTTAGKVFSELAAWETKHVELFEEMRKALPEEARKGDVFDPGSEMAAYIKDAADNHVFVRKTDITALAGSVATPAEAFDLALTFEKDSIVFYTAMKKLVADHLGRDKVDFLIEEEVRHVAILHREKAKLS